MISKTANFLTKESGIDMAPKNQFSDTDVALNFLEGGAVPLGLYGASRQFSNGALTGRRTLYHGTQNKSVAGIKELGLLPTTEKNVVTTNILKDVNPEVYEKALGKSYMHPKKIVAAGSGITAESRGRGLENPLMQDEVPKEFINRLTGKSGIVEINAPTWKMKTVRNPETAMGWEAWYDNVDPVAKMVHPKEKLRNIFNSLDESVVVDGAVPAEYIKGSKHYKGLNLNELKEYISNNKARALGGIGKAGLGLGMAGLSVYDLIRRNKKQHDAQLEISR